ncbi:hypothetical protein EAI_14346, partial [Harpegnathos saltator]
IRYIFERIQRDWNMLKSQAELKIIKKYAKNARLYTIQFFIMSFFALFGYVVMLYLPTFLDLVYPLNESRPKKLPILSEYFFLDEQDYYYPLLVHQSMVIALGITIVIVTETMNMVCIQHGCGLFEITRFLDYFKSTFNPSYMILLILGVASITINLFRLLQAVTVMNDWEELMASGSFVLGQYGYMFTINYFGQKLNDRSFYVFKMTYEASWYTAPVQAQKFLILMQQKMIKGYILNINSLITASLETFASLRRLMDHIERDWNMLKDKRELDIIGRYTYIGSMCTLSFTIFGAVATIVCILLPFIPIIHDILTPLNISRPRQLLFPGEYYIDQRKYFYVISLYLDLALILIIITLLGTETLYVTHVQHACGLFQIASYRMNQAFDESLSQVYTPEKRTIFVYQRIIEAVHIHKRALESIPHAMVQRPIASTKVTTDYNAKKHKKL